MKLDRPAMKPAQMIMLVLSVGLSVIGLVLLWSSFFGTDGLRARSELEQEVADLEQRLHELQTENRRLTVLIEKLASDPQTQKDEIRATLGLIRKDEVILVPSSAPMPGTRP